MTEAYDLDELMNVDELIETFQHITDFANGKSDVNGSPKKKKTWLFCNSDWVVAVKTDDDYMQAGEEINGNSLYTSVWEDATAGVKKMRRRLSVDTGKSVSVVEALRHDKAEVDMEAWTSGRAGVYYWEELGEYRNPGYDFLGYCKNDGAYGDTAVGPNALAITLYVSKGEGKRDPILGTDKERFVQADSVAAILLLTLKNGKPDNQETVIDVRKNQQNFAWAIVAVILAKEGAKMDYSTGRARVPGKGYGGPATPVPDS